MSALLSLQEPSRHELLNYEQHTIRPQRIAHVICVGRHSSNPLELDVALHGDGQARVLSSKVLHFLLEGLLENLITARLHMGSSGKQAGLLVYCRSITRSALHVANQNPSQRTF